MTQYLKLVKQSMSMKPLQPCLIKARLKCSNKPLSYHTITTKLIRIITNILIQINQKQKWHHSLLISIPTVCTLMISIQQTLNKCSLNCTVYHRNEFQDVRCVQLYLLSFIPLTNMQQIDSGYCYTRWRH